MWHALDIILIWLSFNSILSDLRPILNLGKRRNLPIPVLFISHMKWLSQKCLFNGEACVIRSFLCSTFFNSNLTNFSFFYVFILIHSAEHLLKVKVIFHSFLYFSTLSQNIVGTLTLYIVFHILKIFLKYCHNFKPPTFIFHSIIYS